MLFHWNESIIAHGRRPLCPSHVQRPKVVMSGRVPFVRDTRYNVSVAGRYRCPNDPILPAKSRHSPGASESHVRIPWRTIPGLRKFVFQIGAELPASSVESIN
jgi:hypothetical protein